MPFETLHIHVAGENPTKVKKEIEVCADAMSMSVSRFMMFCYEEMRPKLATLIDSKAKKSIQGLK